MALIAKNILDTSAHGVTGVPLRIGDDRRCRHQHPKTWRSASISAWALPPRAGVYVSWETNIVSGAIAERDRCPIGRSAVRHDRSSITSSECGKDRAGFHGTHCWHSIAASTSAIGWRPRSRQPTPCRLRRRAQQHPSRESCRGDGDRTAASAASSTNLVCCCGSRPRGSRNRPSPGTTRSDVTSSAEMITTRSHLPGVDPILGDRHGLCCRWRTLR